MTEANPRQYPASQHRLNGRFTNSLDYVISSRYIGLSYSTKSPWTEPNEISGGASLNHAVTSSRLSTTVTHDRCPLFFSWERRVFGGIARQVTPPAIAFPSGPELTHYLDLIDRYFQGMPRIIQIAMHLLLTVVQLAPIVVIGRPLPFTALRSDLQQRYLYRWDRGRFGLVRSLFLTLKGPLILAYYQLPSVEKAIDFDRKPYRAPPAEPVPDADTRKIIRPESIGSDTTIDVDTVIIGSGAGGAVVGKELAEKGQKVAILEAGEHYTREQFGDPPMESFMKYFYGQGTIFSFGKPPVVLVMGKTVGGSTPFTGGVCFRIPHRVLDEWRDQAGLTNMHPDRLEPYYQRVEKMLSVHVEESAAIGKNSWLVKEGLERIGANALVFKRNTINCLGHSRCSFGCPNNAKQGTHLTYVPAALDAGARIFARTRADKLVIKNRRCVGVEASLLATDGKTVVGRLNVRAKNVVVACGGVMTPDLLLANGLGKWNHQIGKNLSLHPSTRVLGEFDEAIYPWKGAFQAIYSDSFSRDGYLITEVFPGVGPVLGTLTAFDQRGQPHNLSPKNLGTAGFLLEDTSRGTVHRSFAGLTLVSYVMNREDMRRCTSAIQTACRILLAVGAKRLFLPIGNTDPITSTRQIDQINLSGANAGDLELISVHLMGTCRMGTDPDTSVVGPDGQSHQIRNLYVADASIFPSSIGVNPQIAIATLSTMIAEGIAKAS